ncbi:unnamed protein product [Brachionus calyciflorus]|uniref:Uncharacterized protein n=1 Tax=Brachionus calyciflorus TaxID=104777 RepID=A0A814G5F2_9BILA|nr:unnamed protein product [Brachionus calyciflorus]
MDVTNFNIDTIVNMDETSIYLDCPSSYTYDEKGVKRVKASTNGAEKVRISAIFNGIASGQKINKFVLVQLKTDLALYILLLLIMWKFDSKLMQFLTKILFVNMQIRFL